MTENDDDAARRIYKEWHEGFTARDLDRVMVLYAEDAAIETPAVLSMYPGAEEGILRGRQNIRELFERNFKALAGTFEGLYRSELFLSNGRYLLWEYPRLKPTGEQVDLIESMDIDEGHIRYHRVYWGWRGMAALIRNRESRGASPD